MDQTQTNQNPPAEEQKPATPETNSGTEQQAASTAPAQEATPAPETPAPVTPAATPSTESGASEPKDGQPAASPPPVTPTEHPASPPADNSHSGSNAKPLLIVGVIVAAAILGGGALFMMNNTNESKQLGAVQKVRPTVAASPTPMSAEEQAIESIDTGDPEKELQEVDNLYKDLQ